MSAPKPREFKRRLKDVQNLLAVLSVEFDWVYGAAHERTVRDEAKVNTGGRTDPTGSIVASKAYLRRALERADRELRSIDSQLRAIENNLAKALEGTEPRERPEPRFPRTASPADIQASHEAQERRKERGEVTA